MILPNLFLESAFNSTDKNQRAFCEQLLPFINFSQKLRVLDIGCGTGGLLFTLAEKLPNAYLTGVDISPKNIDQSLEYLKSQKNQERFRLICGDYSALSLDKFDVIIAYSSLQHIQCANKILCDKISSELSCGGIFIYHMPYQGFCNKLHYGLRIILRYMRGSWLDEALFRLSRVMYGHKMPDPLLKERIPYMYTLPERLDGKNLRRALENAGLHCLAEHPDTHPNLGKPKHKTVFFKKRPSL